MLTLACWIGLGLIAQASPADNPVLQALTGRGVEANGVAVPLPQPALADGRDASAARAVLRGIAGDDRSVENFVRDSVSAPFVLKTHDTRAGDAIIRGADLYFVVRADLDELDLRQVLGKADDAAVEAGNMRFTNRRLAADDLARLNLDRLPDRPGRDEWFVHATGRLLDRIAVEATDRAVATRTADSLTIATLTARQFDAAPDFPNRWNALNRVGEAETAGPPQVYGGGGSYVKITRLAAEPGALFVEAHLAFVEPQAWFAGNPILRSKFGVIAQDQVRQLRREIQKRRARK